MKALLTSFVSGIVFALGLGISGMTRPPNAAVGGTTRGGAPGFNSTQVA